MMVCKNDVCPRCKWKFEQGEHCEECCHNYDDNFEEEETENEIS